MEYNSYVIRSIIANNVFGITSVNDLISLKSLFFVREEYSEIERLIKSNNVDAIRTLSQKGFQNEEYLEIMSFTDQNEKNYMVTVYDSNALEQDPQVIEIYSMI